MLLRKVLQKLEAIQKQFNASASGGQRVSLADLIVLGGCAAIEKAAKDGGTEVKVPFVPGRMDAAAEQTESQSFAPLEPLADGFRNYLRGPPLMSSEEASGGSRATAQFKCTGDDGAGGWFAGTGCQYWTLQDGVLTQKPGVLTNDFFVNLLDMRTEWQPHAADGVYQGRDRRTRNPDGPARASTSFSGRMRSSERSPRSMRLPTHSRSSHWTSWRPGTK